MIGITNYFLKHNTNFIGESPDKNAAYCSHRAFASPSLNVLLDGLKEVNLTTQNM